MLQNLKPRAVVHVNLNQREPANGGRRKSVSQHDPSHLVSALMRVPPLMPVGEPMLFLT